MSEVEILSLTGLQLTQWTALASATLLLYDHAITLADEVSRDLVSYLPTPHVGEHAGRTFLEWPMDVL